MAPDLKEGGNGDGDGDACAPTPHGQQQQAAAQPPAAQPPPVVPNATVLRTAALSPTVRSLVLKLDGGDRERALDYQAGQWVDVYSDDFAGVGGFSMCAPPSGAAFRERRELELAVKLSRHPPAAWVHDPARCRPGARARLRVGGSFTLALADNHGCDAALFLAGGIGVTALAAMAGELSERWRREENGAAGLRGGGGSGGGGGPRRAAVLYSARRREDFALLPQLREWAAAAADAAAPGGGRMRLQLHLTGEHEGNLPDDQEAPVAGGRAEERWRRGRITPAEAWGAIDALAADAAADAAADEDGGAALPSVGVFVCGPPQMTDELAAAVAEHPLVGGNSRVFTEKWW